MHTCLHRIHTNTHRYTRTYTRIYIHIYIHTSKMDWLKKYMLITDKSLNIKM